MLVPDTQENRDHFGIAKSIKEHKVRAIAGVSILHDVLNRMTYDAIIASYQTGEQTLAWDHLETAELPHKSLMLLDGGYVSFHLLRHIQNHGHRFCVRVRSNLKVVKQLEKTGLSEGSFHFKPSKKSRLKMEQFSEFSPETINQDFHAKTFSEGLASALALEVSDEVEVYSQKTEDEYVVSLTQVLAKMKNTIALLFLRRRWRRILDQLTDQFLINLVARVPGRSARRKKRPNSNNRSPAYAFNR